MPQHVTRSFSQKRSIKNFARVMKRDEYLCRYCNDWADCVDHILPHSYGGTNDDGSLVASCSFCNKAATDKVFDSFEEKREYLQQFISLKIKRRSRKICIFPDCGEFFEYRKNGATAVLCQVCAERDDQWSYGAL